MKLIAGKCKIVDTRGRFHNLSCLLVVVNITALLANVRILSSVHFIIPVLPVYDSTQVFGQQDINIPTL